MLFRSAHRCGCLHRDVKPSNIFIGDDGIVKLGDFGLACFSSDSIRDRSGTRRYLAPEAGIEGRRSEASDQYALGVTFRELTAHLPRVSSDFVSIYEKATALEPTDRYASVAALRDDLQRFLAHRPIVARQNSRAVLQPGHKPPKRHPPDSAACQERHLTAVRQAQATFADSRQKRQQGVPVSSLPYRIFYHIQTYLNHPEIDKRKTQKEHWHCPFGFESLRKASSEKRCLSVFRRVSNEYAEQGPCHTRNRKTNRPVRRPHDASRAGDPTPG